MSDGLRHRGLLRARLALALAALASIGAYAAPGAGADGIQVTIHDASGSHLAPLIHWAEVGQNVDVEPQPTLNYFASGMSPERLIELVGVDPATLAASTAMTITDTASVYGGNGNGTYLPSPNPLTAAEVTSGFSIPAGSPVRHAVFWTVGGYVGPNITPQYLQPTLMDADGGALDPDELPTDFATPFLVDVYVSGTVLGVPQPSVACVGSRSPSQPVQFSVNPHAVTLGLAAGDPADGSPLTYSWNFGDGQSTSPSPSPSAPPHLYGSTGTFTARVTVEDAAGNGGTSTLPAQVEVDSSGPICNAQGQNGNGPPGQADNGTTPSPDGGTQPTGGGAGGANTISSGPAHGSIKSTTATAAPRTTGAPGATPASRSTPASSTSGSSTSTGGGGHGSTGSAGGSGGGGGGAGHQGSGSGRSGSSGRGHSLDSNSTVSGGTITGAGAGHAKPPATAPVPGAPAAQNLTGILIESSGSPLATDDPADLATSLSLLQSVARASTGSGGHGGLPAWLLGILAVVALLVSGVMREGGPGRRRRPTRPLRASPT